MPDKEDKGEKVAKLVSYLISQNPESLNLSQNARLIKIDNNYRLFYKELYEPVLRKTGIFKIFIDGKHEYIDFVSGEIKHYEDAFFKVNLRKENQQKIIDKLEEKIINES